MGPEPAALLLAFVAAAPLPAQSPATVPVDPAPPGTVLPLARGEVFLPEGFAARGGRADLLVHFHGAPRAVERAAVEGGWSGAVLVFTLPGLSSVYRERFRDEAAFPNLLEEGRAAVRAAAGAGDPEWGRIVLSAYSAGYAAIREILRVPAWSDRVDAVILADSLHAGYDAPGRPSSRDLEAFRAFARRAANGEKVLWSTHSAIVPDGYASTRQTNDDLIAAAGATRVAVRETTPLGMVLSSRADRGGFHVLGFDGADAESHRLHLRYLGALYARLGARAEAAAPPR